MKVLNQQGINAYLNRLEHAGDTKPTLRNLRHLHRAHLLHIPFENLDIHWGEQIILDPQRIFKKIAINGRGGFCYELNGLFYQLLMALKYECHLASARMYTESGELTPEFDHVVILVKLESRHYLCDVGSGKCFLQPKELKMGLVQVDYNAFFKIERTHDGEFVLFHSEDGTQYKRKYLFTRRRREFVEFVDRCHWQQTDPRSLLKKQKMITQATKDGRITLTDQMLTIEQLGKTTEQPILNEDEFYVKLMEYFGISKS